MVARAAPFHWTVEELMKFVPVRTSMKPDPPAVVVLGAMLASVGTGFGGGGGDAIVKVFAVEVPPPGAGVKTVTAAVPDDTRSLGGIIAVSVELLMYAVVLGAPFHRTVELEMKLLPLTVSVKPGSPAVAVLGEIKARIGAGFGATLIVKIWLAEVPPPGVGLKTVTVAVPEEMISVAGIDAVKEVLLT